MILSSVHSTAEFRWGTFKRDEGEEVGTIDFASERAA